MRFNVIRNSIFALILLFCLNNQAQNILKGTIKDEIEGFPIPYAQIKIDCLKAMFMADVNGNFNIEIKPDSCDVTFLSSSYSPIQRTIIFTPKNREYKLDIKLTPSAILLDPAKVVSSKYETNPEKSTNSILVLSPKEAENKNLNTVDGLLNTAGGIAVVDNEPQIRGGSGFSSGMGSRVMILLDNIPMLRPDAGRPMWNFIPMEDVEQIEILKGAASLVFGSSALTGAINVLTAYPRTKPKTKVILFAGIYSDPKNPYQTSWNHQNPIKFGVSFLHSRIIKKNFDFVIGGEYFDDQGYIGPEESISSTRNTNGSTKGKYERRARFNFATRYRFQKIKGLSVSLNGNIMASENAQSFFWFDADTNRYRTYKGSLSKFKDFTGYLDPSVKYISKGGFVHTFRNRILYSKNIESTGAQSAESGSVFDEYQFNKNIPKIGMNIVAGVMNNFAISNGRVFSGDNYSDKPTRMSYDNFSIYTQLEQKFLKNRNLTIIGGGRWEFYSLDNVIENKPIFRAGINYQLNKTKTSFRGSFGQGYRFPSIGEKFIAISVGRFGFYPNPDLQSENSWNAEVGIMQPFSLFDFQGFFDVAFFNQEFENYIEFAMGPWGNSGSIIDRMGFKYLNIGPARISGLDFSFMGEGVISKNVTYSLMVSYTYSNPITKNRNYVYYTDPVTHKEYTFLNSSSDTSRNVLKYRIEHMGKLDLAFTFYKKFTVGLSANYYSSMHNVDKFFFDYDINNPNNTPLRIAILKLMGDLPFSGYYNYFMENKKGSVVFDARVSYNINRVTLSFIVKNLLNKSYTLRPMYVEPLRTFTIQVIYNIN